MGCMKSGSVVSEEYVIFFLHIVTHLSLLFLYNIKDVVVCSMLTSILFSPEESNGMNLNGGSLEIQKCKHNILIVGGILFIVFLLFFFKQGQYLSAYSVFDQILSACFWFSVYTIKQFGTVYQHQQVECLYITSLTNLLFLTVFIAPPPQPTKKGCTRR
jgi:hypothetical protein